MKVFATPLGTVSPLLWTEHNFAFTDYLEYKESEAKNTGGKLKSDSQKRQERGMAPRIHSVRGEERQLSHLLSWVTAKRLRNSSTNQWQGYLKMPEKVKLTQKGPRDYGLFSSDYFFSIFITSHYCYKEMLYSQVNDTFFPPLLVTVFDTKIRCLHRSVSRRWELPPASHCLHSSCDWVCWTFLFSPSQFTHISLK